MKKIGMLFCSLLSLFSLCSCTETRNWCGVKFNYEVFEVTYYPIQTTYAHYNLKNNSCPDYEHFEIKSFTEKERTWRTTGYKGASVWHTEFLGLNVITTNNDKIFLKKDNINFFVNECPYCKGD